MSAFASGCYGKERFKTWGAANRVQARRVKNRRLRDGHREDTIGHKPYRCKFCGFFHLGQSRPEAPKEEMRRLLERYEGTDANHP